MKPEVKMVQLSEEAKTILEHLKEFGEEILSQLKENSNLSNKKWDKGIKELTNNKITKVEKREDTLYVIQL